MWQSETKKHNFWLVTAAYAGARTVYAPRLRLSSSGPTGVWGWPRVTPNTYQAPFLVTFCDTTAGNWVIFRTHRQTDKQTDRWTDRRGSRNSYLDMNGKCLTWVVTISLKTISNLKQCAFWTFTKWDVFTASLGYAMEEGGSKKARAANFDILIGLSGRNKLGIT